MLNTQNIYINYLYKVSKELGKSVINLQLDESMSQKLNDAELIIPIIGAFSAGKSTLINSFLGNEYLPVDITPETSIPTELRYSEEEYIEAVQGNNDVIIFDLHDMPKIKNRAEEFKLIKVFINNMNLKEIEPLILVDMPGFNSPLDLHNKAIIDYLNRGMHYIVLIGIEEGTITRSLSRQLLDIKAFKRDCSFFLSKSNLKPPQEVEEVKKQIVNQVSELCETEKNIIAIGNDGGESLSKILTEIEPEELFKDVFLEELKNNYFIIDNMLNTAIVSMEGTKDDNDKHIADMERSVKVIASNRDQITSDIKEQYSIDSINIILDVVGKNLSLAIDELVTYKISGGDEKLIKNITEIVRHTLVVEIRNYMTNLSTSTIEKFEEELKNLTETKEFNENNQWLDQINEQIKYMFTRTNISSDYVENNSPGSDIGSLLSLAASVLSPLIDIFTRFLPNIFGESREKREEEKIKKYLLTMVIPTIKMELRKTLVEIMDYQVTHLVRNISEEFEKKLKSNVNILLEVEAEKKKESETIIKKIETMTYIKEKITNLSNDVLFKGNNDGK
jgi:GTPase SAR1 family protein